MSFLELPLEVKQRIISYLPSHSDVAALSVQCRALHSISDMATRKKYHHISVSPSEDGTEVPFGLLMDILKRPTLGHYVRHVECCTPTARYKDYEETKPQRGLSDEDMNLVQAAVRKAGFTGPSEHQVVNMLMQRWNGSCGGFGVPRRQFPRRIIWRKLQMSALNIIPWQRSNMNRDEESRATFVAQALTAIFIAVSPGLVSMAMAVPFYGGSRFPTKDYPLAKFLRQVNSEPESKTYLQHLRDVYLINIKCIMESSKAYYQEMDFYGCCDLFDNLPSIESVSADLLEDVNESGKQDFVEKCSNISRISLHHSSVTSTYLARLIWSCKSLKEFQYSIGGRSSDEGGYAIFSFKLLLKVLCGYKDTLEILDIDCKTGMFLLDEEEAGNRIQEDETPFEPDIPEERLMFLKAIWRHGGSLKEFGALKRLSLGIKYLLYLAKGVSGESDDKRDMVSLAECLPDSLEYLCVRGYERGVNSEHDEQMDALMALYRSGSSNLKEVRGIEKLIPHSDDVEPKDKDRLWSLEERGYKDFYLSM